MTKSELKPLYVEASARARTKPSQSEEAVWYSKLGQFDIADLSAAIDAHFAKSHWMPKESELRPLAEQAKRGRFTQANAKTTYARWQCPIHPAIIVGGFVEPNDYRARRCPKQISDKQRNPDGPVICAEKMVPIFREDDFQTGNTVQKEQVPEMAK
jgi:hypothetical protein